MIAIARQGPSGRARLPNDAAFRDGARRGSRTSGEPRAARGQPPGADRGDRRGDLPRRCRSRQRALRADGTARAHGSVADGPFLESSRGVAGRCGRVAFQLRRRAFDARDSLHDRPAGAMDFAPAHAHLSMSPDSRFVMVSVASLRREAGWRSCAAACTSTSPGESAAWSASRIRTCGSRSSRRGSATASMSRSIRYGRNSATGARLGRGSKHRRARSRRVGDRARIRSDPTSG